MKKLLWLDYETTGIEAADHDLLEVAVIITDDQLKVLDRFETTIHQLPPVLDKMDEWCWATHTKSGLLDSGIEEGMHVEDAEDTLIHILKKHFPEDKGKVIICGNTIDFDRSFMKIHMPTLFSWLHYRSVNVTSFGLVIETLYSMRRKNKNAHRAMADVEESIEQLKWALEFMKGK